MCLGGSLSAVNNGTLTIDSQNFKLESAGDFIPEQLKNYNELLYIYMDKLAFAMGATWGSLVMSPWVSLAVYSTVCQMNSAFIGYDTSYGGKNLTLASQSVRKVFD